MPYKKKYVAKKRRSFKSRKTSVVKKLVKKVNRLYRGVESKHWRVAGLGAAATNNPSLAIKPYESISQGTADYGNRIGDQLTATFIKFKSVWTLGAGFVGGTARIVVFVMKDSADAPPAAATAWNYYSESTYANSVNIVNANKDWDNRKGFITLYDKKICINPTTTTLSTKRNWDINIPIPQSCQLVKYSAATTSVTANDVYIWLIADTDTAFAVDYLMELFYKDP